MYTHCLLLFHAPPEWPSGERVGLVTWCEKSSRWLWKESCVSSGVRKPGNTCASLTTMI